MIARVVAATVTLGIALVLGGASAAEAATPAPSSPAASSSPSPQSSQSDTVAPGSTYPGNPKSESLIKANEDQRLIQVRAVVNAANITGAAAGGPYRLLTGKIYTLVLTARPSPWTFDDLLALEPQSLVRQPDGAYLLKESIIVDAGAALDISSTTGLTLRMSSSSDYFVSIQTLGGSLAIVGSQTKPVTISSWDPTSGRPDTDTSDGRAYLRVVGGHAEIAYAQFSDLGFWSGETGGLALTGTQKASAQTTIPTTAPGAPPVGRSKKHALGIIPATPATLGTVPLAGDSSGYSYVSASVRHASFTGDAFGLFVSSADGVAVANSSANDSLVDGIVFHRNVTNSTISNTTASGNAEDGIILTRATSGVDLTKITADGNGHNGITIEGGALAQGPNATGVSVAVYGNNSISNSTMTDNLHDGVAVIGGTNMRVIGNTISNSVSGIVVSKAATQTVIKNNFITNSSKQGIVLRGTGTNNTVQRNTIDVATIGIYARDGGGTFDYNTIENVNSHGITLVGATGSSMIEHNTVSGVGYSAVDVARTHGAHVGVNYLTRWTSTKPLGVVLRGIFQPLTVMWILIGLFVLIAAFIGLGRRKKNGIRNPYENLAPLSTYTEGVVSIEELRGSHAMRHSA